MKKPQTVENTSSLEQRVVILENELAKIQDQLAKQPLSHWWLKVAGSMEADPTFEEAMKLGQEWRKSQ